ncbi:hypothetical protein [Marinobacter sp. ATCH36]|uniref:hypothetical protein n=1 Tax=Marinobacter sp. ATCH36 TaxID=2945106 RepID=UPI00202119E3|nr:hypothetical protein [Marinobacter sp. ATCH36]MCL7944676.1 hypothetical protein [Marinobacter sp. ATCH36]
MDLLILVITLIGAQAGYKLLDSALSGTLSPLTKRIESTLTLTWSLKPKEAAKQLGFDISPGAIEAQIKHLDSLIDKFEDILHITNKVYIYISPMQWAVTDIRHLSKSSKLLLKVRAIQESVYCEIESLFDISPFPVLCFAKFLDVYLDRTDLLIMSDPDAPIDDAFMEATYIPKVMRCRFGDVDYANSNIEKTLETIKSGVGKAKLDADAVKSIRRYEKLSNTVLTSLKCTKWYLQSIKSTKEIDSNFVISVGLMETRHLIDVARMKSGDPRGEPDLHESESLWGEALKLFGNTTELSQEDKKTVLDKIRKIKRLLAKLLKKNSPHQRRGDGGLRGRAPA